MMMPSAAPIMSPKWWADRLTAELSKRRPYGQFMQRYADGDHDNPTVQPKSTKAFLELLDLSKTNLTGLIVEVTAERLGIQGFQFGDDPDGDAEAWRIWQTSDFDSESELAITAALTVGRSFVLVEPPQSDGALPRLYAEDAENMVVAYTPGRRTERLAAFKTWVDEWTGQQHGTLYLPDAIYKLRSSAFGGAWTFRDDRVEAEPNPLGVVPVFELSNRPSLKIGSVKSEIHDVIRDQNACNKISLAAGIVMEMGAHRQKWVTGLEVPRDPVTGEPVEPFDVAVDRILVAEGDLAKFGNFEATDLAPYIAMYESRVKHMAGVSRTPLSLLLGVGDNVSADAIALSVSGLVEKVHRRQKHFEQPLEQAMRLAFASIGDPRAFATTAAVLWTDADVKSAAQAADAAVKLAGGPVITRQTAQERILGMTETERNRDQAWLEQGDAVGALDRVLGALVDPDVP